MGQDRRVRFHVGSVVDFLKLAKGQRYDLIFADAWPGKYDHVAEALDLLQGGGLYIIDDMLPQPNWPADHAPKVPRVIAVLEQRADLLITKMCWSTGLIVVTKKA